MIAKDFVSVVVATVFLGVLSWVGVTTQQVSVQQAVLEVKLTGLEQLIADQGSNFMPRTEIDLKFQRQDERIAVLTEKVSELESINRVQNE